MLGFRELTKVLDPGYINNLYLIILRSEDDVISLAINYTATINVIIVT